MESAPERLGQNVRAARQQKGWTQEDLAGASGLSVVQISRIERGKREIRLTTLLKLVAALGLPPSELLDGLF